MDQYVVIARFAAAADGRFIRLGERLKAAGYPVPAWPPHITVAAYENLGEAPLCAWAEAFAKVHQRQTVGLLSASILPPGEAYRDTAVLCVAPSYSKAFVDFYYDFHAKYEEYCTGVGAFNAIAHGNPVIHATLGIINAAAMQAALDILFQSGVFGPAQITALEVYAYPMRLIRRFELQA